MKKNLCVLLLCSLTVISYSQKKIMEKKYLLSEALKEQYEYIQDENGSFIKDGFYKQWYENGTIKESGFYKNNKKHGEWKEFNEKGQKKIASNYKNGLKNGPEYKWSEDSITSVEDYVNDTINGHVISKYSNGKIYTEYNVKMGKRNGKIYTYFKNGKIETIANWDNDVRTGRWQEYSETGELLKDFEFKNDICVSLIGNWAGESRKDYYTFRQDGTFTNTYPIFANSLSGNDPMEEMNGKFDILGFKFFMFYKHEQFDYETFYLVRINTNEIIVKKINDDGTEGKEFKIQKRY